MPGFSHSIGWTPWNKKTKAPYQHAARPGWNGKPNLRGIRVYKSEGRAAKASPHGIAKEVFIQE